MRSARRLYRLNAVVAVPGLLGVAGTLMVTLRAIDFEHGSVGAFVAACEQILLPQDLTMLAVIAMGSVSVATLGLAVSSIARRGAD